MSNTFENCWKDDVQNIGKMLENDVQHIRNVRKMMSNTSENIGKLCQKHFILFQQKNTRQKEAIGLF